MISPFRFLLSLIYILFSGIWHLLAAQNAQVTDIFEEYITTQEKIRDNAFYINDFYLNANQHNWNEKVSYQRTEKYFYALATDTKPILQLLRVQIDSSGRKYQLEYLYNPQGEVVYWVEKQNLPQYHYKNLSMYFHQNTVIQLNEDLVVIKSSNIFLSQKIRFVLESAQWFWEKFQEMNQLKGTDK